MKLCKIWPQGPVVIGIAFFAVVTMPAQLALYDGFMMPTLIELNFENNRLFMHNLPVTAIFKKHCIM